MSRYAAADEERIVLQEQVRDWTRAGLLTPAQGAQLESELKVDLRRTGRMLRLGLAVFTVVAAAAAVGFILLFADVDSDRLAAVLVLMAGVGCVVAADRLVERYRLYRHGVEEALAVSGVVFGALGIGLLTSTFHLSWASVVVGALAVGAVGAFGVYLRFGLRYAAVGAIACLAFIPLQTRLPVPIRLLVASATLAGIFAWGRGVRRANQDNLKGDDARTLEAVAILGTYLMLNLEVSGSLIGIGGSATLLPWFKWTTYVLVWLLPPMIVWAGVRERERLLIDVGIVTFLVTMITNSQYLGRTTNPWDPIVFGVVVAGAAILVRRWIAAGPAEGRNGFTTVRVSAREGDVLAAIGTASATFHPGLEAQPGVDRQSDFNGGRSGGAGGGADF
jgi:hypothetical protein